MLIRTKSSKAKFHKIGSRLLLSKHLIVRGDEGGRFGEIKFDGAIRPVPVEPADNQNGGKLMQSADLYRV